MSKQDLKLFIQKEIYKKRKWVSMPSCSHIKKTLSNKEIEVIFTCRDCKKVDRNCYFYQCLLLQYHLNNANLTTDKEKVAELSCSFNNYLRKKYFK
ncbi:MAG: hypothetical protein ACTSRP_09115 [Candidatus Helarchaeota archaeon]